MHRPRSFQLKRKKENIFHIANSGIASEAEKEQKSLQARCKLRVSLMQSSRRVKEINLDFISI